MEDSQNERTQGSDGYLGDESTIIHGEKPIGARFFDELVAHGGLTGEHFTWSSTGALEFFEDTPKNVVEGVKAVYTAHDPTKTD